MTVLTIVGARPQFIKAGPVSRALTAAGADEFLVHTGQHYDAAMSDVFFQELGLPSPDRNLNVGSGSHGAQTAAMLKGIEEAILEVKPDWVLIYGDTNSTLAGALAAAKLHVPVAHVEAGLRSFNRKMPEEVNRIVADTLATLLFTPTEAGRQNLLREGVPPQRIVLSGDVMQDAALIYRSQALERSGIMASLGLREKEFVLATVHRAENTDAPERLRAIMEGLGAVARDIPVVVPLHPRTRKMLDQLGIPPSAGLRLVEPVGFLDMMRLTMAAGAVATDSGGLQKEAFFHRVPCVTMRDETEWVELVEGGFNRLVKPLSASAIVAAVAWARGVDSGVFDSATDLYGGGRAAATIADALVAWKA